MQKEIYWVRPVWIIRLCLYEMLARISRTNVIIKLIDVRSLWRLYVRLQVLLIAFKVRDL